jgi:hypothetical protein
VGLAWGLVAGLILGIAAFTIVARTIAASLGLTLIGTPPKDSLRAGMAVTLFDVSEEALQRAADGVKLADSVLDQFGTEQVEGGGISFVGDLAEALDGAELVAEAVPERLELKHEVFARFEELAPTDAILASNTSGIPITKTGSSRGPRTSSACTGRIFARSMIEVIPGERTARRPQRWPLVERLTEAIVERGVRVRREQVSRMRGGRSRRSRQHRRRRDDRVSAGASATSWR